MEDGVIPEAAAIPLPILISDDIKTINPSISLVHSPIKGRCVIATALIPRGQTIMSIKSPAGFAPYLTFRTRTCHACGKLERPSKCMACPSCDGVGWCTRCKRMSEEEQSIHHPPFECSTLKLLLHRWGEFQDTRIPFEEIALVVRLIIMSTLREPSCTTAEMLLAMKMLESNPESGGAERSQEGRKRASAMLSETLAIATNRAMIVSPAECSRLLAMLLTNTFMVSMKTKTDKTMPYAMALYSSASFFNHSCFPNAARMHPLGSGQHACLELVLVALQDIQPGQEICIRYGTPVGEVQDAYAFTCCCEACVGSSNGDHAVELLSPFSCPVGLACGGLLISVEGDDGLFGTNFQCNTCEKRFALSDISPMRRKRMIDVL